MNSVGILLRHLDGNLQQWLVDGVPQHDNHRNRASEFHSEARQPAEQLMNQLCLTVDSAVRVLNHLSSDELVLPREIQGFSELK